MTGFSANTMLTRPSGWYAQSEIPVFSKLFPESDMSALRFSDRKELFLNGACKLHIKKWPFGCKATDFFADKGLR